MSASATDKFATRMEAHFGDRVVRCYRDRPKNVYQMFADAVARNPAGDAVVCGSERHTWTELHVLALRVAGGLAERGIRAGDRIALVLGNRTEFPVAVLAAAALGAIVVPISIREQTPGLQYLLTHCAAAAVFHDDDLADRLPPAAELPDLKLRIAAGANAGAGSESFAALAQAAPLAQTADAGEEDVAAILYTSGTTGRPKGAMLTHLNIVHSAMHYEQLMGLTTDDRAAAVVPLSHVTGLVALQMAMMRVAGTLLVVPVFKAREFLELAARERMTTSIMVPAMYNLCLLQDNFDTVDLSAWRIGGYGGAPMPVATIEALAKKLPRIGLINAYGATETTSPATMSQPSEAATHGHTVGRAVTCADILIVDDAGRELAPGETGEIWLRGPMVVKGYWNNPTATAENFTGGYWHSGDIGSLDADGYLSVFDRRKDMLNRGGYKIYSVEVENVLAAHPAVLEAAVVGKPCPVLGERVHVFIAARDEHVEAEELRAFCAARLADYKLPESFTIRVEPLPRNANGKLLKREMREALLASLQS